MANENVEKIDVDITKVIPQTIKDAFLNGVAYDRAKNTLDTTAAEKLQFSLNTNEVLKNKYVSNCSDYITDYFVAVRNNLDPEARQAFQKDYNKYMLAYSAGGTDGIAKFLRESYKEHGEELTVGKGKDLIDHKFREGDIILYKSDKVKGKEMGHGAMVFQENGQWFVAEMQGKEKGFEKTPLKEWLAARGDKEMTVGNLFLSLEKKLEKEPEIKEPKIKAEKPEVKVEQPKPREPVLDNREKDGEPKVKRKDIPDDQLPKPKGNPHKPWTPENTKGYYLEEGKSIPPKRDPEPKPVKIEPSVPNKEKEPTEPIEPKIPSYKTSKELERWRNETCGMKVEEERYKYSLHRIVGDTTYEEWRRDGNKCSQKTWDNATDKIIKQQEIEKSNQGGNDKDNGHSNNRGNDSPNDSPSNNGGDRSNDSPGRSGSSYGYNG